MMLLETIQAPILKPAPVSALDPAIFREYDIRGVAGKTLRAEDAYLIARAFATKIARIEPVGDIYIGRDGRLSSPALHAAICQGLRDCGRRVVDIGIGPTPMLYFAAYTAHAAGGIMITGSHNPPEYNGMKLVWQNMPFYGKAIQSLRSMSESGDFIVGKGRRDIRDIREDYLEALLNAYDGERPLSIAWDAGNGAAGEIVDMLCARLPGTHLALNTEIDGTFPAHHPDPTVPETLAQLIEAVTGGRLDAGIAFDGDGDRIGVIDDEGEILWGDQLLMLYAAHILKEKPGATVIADVKASGALFEEITRLGGTPLMWKTGHSLIKSKMAQTGAVLAGEMSGHIFFADKYYGYDDALYAAIRLLSLLSRSGGKLSQLRKALPRRVNTPEIRFPCDDGRKFSVIREVQERLEKAGAQFSAIDGVRVDTDDGWWLLRASNTQPVLVARCEALSAASLARLKNDLHDQLSLSDIPLP
jgi:phosphomannomutase